MGIVVAFAVLLLLVLAASVTVLVRRESRRFSAGPDSARVEAKANRDLREARGRVRMANRLAAPGTLGALRDRDDRSRY
ncbi:hypothetical protein [Streptomyces sp. ME18-1-4]|uniref:hypothetical protein n=1 Tax=Streptomyces sp. ME18-1-4 TaxID=3028685 RepID=UPI0029AD6028|nr:hypothetical protein [Streptomyces sp. ME18-1-4]MDX3241422.1 hypothetical protein [Streptomyces sp. ME18-1-4]